MNERVAHLRDVRGLHAAGVRVERHLVVVELGVRG
jgi:uncharacterized metal-binding protein